MKDTWQTPWDIVDNINRDRPLTMDVACDVHNAKAPVAVTDAFNTNWADLHALVGGWVWCNPPYSDPSPWVDAIISYRLPTILLINVASSAKWFHDCIENAGEWWVFKGRIAFVDPDTGLPIGGNDRSQCAFIFDWLGEPLKTISVDIKTLQTHRKQIDYVKYLEAKNK